MSLIHCHDSHRCVLSKYYFKNNKIEKELNACVPLSLKEDFPTTNNVQALEMSFCLQMRG